MQKQRNLIILIAVVALFVGFFIYKDLKNKKEVNLQNNETVGKVEVGLPGATEVKAIPIYNGEISTPVNIPVPDLNREIVFKIPFSDSDKTKITAKINELISILKKNNNSFDEWISLGFVRKAIGDYEGARQAWEYASAIRPKNSLSFMDLGDLYHYYLKDYPKAEQNLKRAIENDPSNISTYRALVDLYTLSYKEKLSEVPNVVAGGLKNNPDQYDLLIMMASYYKEAGDRANAKMYYEKALSVADKFGMTASKPSLSDEIQKLSQ